MFKLSNKEIFENTIIRMHISEVKIPKFMQKFQNYSSQEKKVSVNFISEKEH
jgi:hypothetical protein